MREGDLWCLKALFIVAQLSSGLVDVLFVDGAKLFLDSVEALRKSWTVPGFSKSRRLTFPAALVENSCESTAPKALY